MEQERENQRRTYQICRLGFGVLSAALVLASVTTVLTFAHYCFLLIGRGGLGWLLPRNVLNWINAPIVWGSLVGTYLLWGRWSESGWQRRAGLLVSMGIVDVLLWFLDHGDELGLRLGQFGHEWLRHALGQALGWAEFALIAGLACDLLAHLGIDHAPEAGKATRSLAATGAVVWMLLFCIQTNWRGWPLVSHGFRTPETLLLFLGTEVIWMITMVQVTALTIAASRQASRAVVEMDREDQESDLLQFRSEL